MAALLLASSVMTMLPRPGGGRGAFVRAAERAPGYLRFMESLEWTRPLWDQGVIEGTFDGRDVGDDVRKVCTGIERDPALLELRAVMRPGIFEDDERSLNAIAADLLKGGPDPAVSVPVAAGLDRFAALHHMIVARASAVSVAQRAEAELSTPLFAIGAPVLMQAGGERLLEARETLAHELGDLRGEVQAAVDSQDPGDAKRGRGAPPRALKLASDAYAGAFDAARMDLTRPGDDGYDPRTIAGVATLSFASLPVDAVLTSSLAAVRTLSRGGARAGSAEPTTLPMERDEAAGLRITGMVVKLLGKPGRK